MGVTLALAATLFIGGPARAAGIGETERPLRPATLRVSIDHDMTEGRLVLTLDDQAVLSAPLAALARDGGASHERILSILEGRHALAVVLLDGRGRVVARKVLSTTVEPDAGGTLVIAEHRGSGDGLTLIWRTP
jgi:hypothetical protein